MYINPQSVVKILRGVPWHSDLKHTRLFRNLAEQNTFMADHVKYTVDGCTYIREQQALRVNILADNLYDCNYICFQNRGFGTKNFYAFITDVKYINNETSEIYFELDYFQTWWFSIELDTCYVEREHVDEGIDCGEVLPQEIYHHYFGVGENNKWKVKLVAKPNLLANAMAYVTAQDWNMENQENQVGLPMFSTTPSDTVGINGFITAQQSVQNDILDVSFYPEYFESGNIVLRVDTFGIKIPTQFNMPDIQGNFKYVPKNNKLLTYPYTFLRVSNNEGEEKDFKWENFYNPSYIEFYMRHNLVNKTSCFIECRSYEGGNVRNTELWINDFPEAQLSASDVSDAIKGALSILTSAIPIKGDYNVNSALSMVDTKAHDTLGVVGNAMNIPLRSKTVGNINKNCLLKYNLMGFSFYVMCIRPEYARILDNYLTRFGYKINRYKRPELYTRQYFNYIKTRDCDLKGTAPDDALRNISEMFNRGVTLWHIDDVGGIYPDNPIVTP